MPPTRLGLIGFGQLAQAVHWPVLQALGQGGGLDVVAVAEADADRQDQVRGLIPGAAVYTDYQDLLRAEEVEAVVISLPTHLHAEAAVAALRGGKHVYLEKPIATSVAEAQPILDAWRQAEVVGRVGFNYRLNPLYRRLKQRIGAGAIGQVLAVRTSFCTPARAVPSWRQARASGGGVLLDLASHHIDQIRFLFDAEVADVSATVRSIQSEADTALLTLRLSSGVEVQSLFSSTALDEDRWEIIGQRGKLALDRYRSLDVEMIPAGGEFSMALRLRNRLAALGQLPYVLAKRRAAGHEPSFLLSMASFLGAVRGEPTAGADLNDGLRSLAVIEAAEQSAAGGGAPVTLVHEPLAAVNASSASARAIPAQSPATDHPHGARGRLVTATPLAEGVKPALSVILATSDHFGSIRRTLRFLRKQTVAGQLELVLIAPDAATFELEPEELGEFLAYSVVEVGPIRSHSVANATGVRYARADVIVCAEDHAFPQPGWAEALIGAHRQPHAAVGPVVHNANPRTLVSWADLLIAYGPWLEPHPGGAAPFLPGHNTSYKRELLLAYGDRLAEMMTAETVLHWDLRARGHTLRVEPGARLAHTNFGLLPIFLRVQYHCGRIFAAARAMDWPWPRRLFYAAASPLIPLVRGWRVFKALQRIRSECLSPLRVMPVVLLGLAVDALGQLVGYVAGPGRSGEKIADYEFNRWRYAGPGAEQSMDTPPASASAANPVVHEIPCGAGPSAAPQMSVILVTPSDFDAIAKTIHHLRAQEGCDQLELIIAASSLADLKLNPAAIAGFGRVRVLEVGPVKAYTPAKIAAARVAGTPIVAYGEDHCYPQPGWARSLIEAHRDPNNAAVGPVVLNANPSTLRSWANYIGCFARWCEPIESGPIDQIPWHNTSYKRELLLSYESRLEDLLDVEGLLQEDLRRRGYQVFMQAQAKVRHVNISRFSSLIFQAFCGGRIYGASRARNGHWSLARRLLYIGGAPLIPLVRLRRELQTIHRIGQAQHLLPRIIPLLLAQLAAHASGEACGYILGTGGVKRRYASYEMFRRRHITAADLAEDLREAPIPDPRPRPHTDLALAS
jgi:predicted dehydrogenase